MEDSLFKVPSNILLLIFSYLSWKELVQLEKTSKRLKKYLKEKEIWKRIYIQKFKIEEEDNKNWKELLIRATSLHKKKFRDSCRKKKKYIL